MLFEQLKWPELPSVSQRVFVVPLGSLEQHGPHLPLATDSWIVGEIARRLESKAPEEIVLLPTQWLGHSPHHRKFGCVSLDVRPYIDLIGGLCRSLVHLGARRIFLLNGHGGNDVPVRAALREVKDMFPGLRELYVAFASYWSLAATSFAQIRDSPKGGMGHACEMETSILLAIHPEHVDMQKAAANGLASDSPWLQHDMLSGQPYYLVNDFDEITRTGVFGMPQFASAEKGERFLMAAVDSALTFIREFRSWNYQEC
jgi:creatinine amidohydrolase